MRAAGGCLAIAIGWLAGCLDAPAPREADVDDCRIFPADNPWNTDVSGYTVHPDSEQWIESIGRWDGFAPQFGAPRAGLPFGKPFALVPGSQPRVPVSFLWDEESDPGPYPVPPDAPIEVGEGTDGHVLVVDVDDCRLYEMFAARAVGGGASWEAEAGAVFDLESNSLRPDRWTSADSAGLPVFPGLVRYDEVVEDGVIDHALRVSVPAVQAGYVAPARHAPTADEDPTLPPMGARLRMKADHDCTGLGAEAQVICAALKRYGLLIATRGGAWFLDGAPDERWDDDHLADLGEIPGDAMEVVYTGEITPW
jgi:hypothetical protein